MSADQRREVLATTRNPKSGYPVLDDPEGWGHFSICLPRRRIGAFNSDVTLTMDTTRAAKFLYQVADRWMNDISGNGKLTLDGNGMLKLLGNNTYFGVHGINTGVLGRIRHSTSPCDVVNAGGTLVENVPQVTVEGSFTQADKGTLDLTWLVLLAGD